MVVAEFDFQADQIFVVAPRNTGGGILSLLISLDSNTASLDFRHKTLAEKILDWNRHTANSKGNSHLYGRMNFGHPDHVTAMHNADRCARYVHKCHFFELDGVSETQRHPLLDKITGGKQSIGIYLTDACIEKLLSIRPQTPQIDWYQLWVYNKQKSLLADFYEVDCRHVLPFSHMLEPDTLIDHVKYCRDVLALNIDSDILASVIHQWHAILLA